MGKFDKVLLLLEFHFMHFNCYLGDCILFDILDREIMLN